MIPAANRTHRRRFSAALLLLALHAPLPAFEPLPVPPPLDGLEAGVQDDLRSAAAWLAEAPAPPDTPEQAVALAERYGELGHRYHAHELWDAATAAYRNARRLQPDQPLWDYALAVVAFKRGETAAAQALFERVLDQEPGHPPSSLFLAEIALQQGRAGDARTLADAVLARGPSPAALVSLGRALQAEGDPRAAAERFREALDLVPQANRLHYLLGMALRAAGDMDGARAQLARAGSVGVRLPDPLETVVQRLRSGARVHLVEGDTAVAAGRHADALDAYERALEADPEATDALAGRAVALAALDRVDEARSALEAVLARAPEHPTAALNLARLQAHAGEHAAAVENLRALLGREPANAGAHRQMAESLLALGREADALPHLERALFAAPTDEALRFRLAALWVEQGRFAAARDLLDEGVGLDPSSLRLTRALARILAAAPEAGVRDGARAAALMQPVVATTAAGSDVELLALALGEAGRCDEAGVLYQRLAEDDPDPARAARWRERAARAAQGSCRPPL